MLYTQEPVYGDNQKSKVGKQRYISKPPLDQFPYIKTKGSKNSLPVFQSHIGLLRFEVFDDLSSDSK